MLSTILTLLPKVTSVVASLPEFVAVIKAAAGQLHEDDQVVLKNALALAQAGSDEANAELAALIASRT